MTSVPPAQPPAAPETDVRLTEAERSYGRIDPSLQWRGRWYSEASVEGIVAERVRVVEGERDHWRGVAIRRERLHDQIDAAARAESAEAAHRALQAAVEALADEWEADFMAYRHDNPGHLRLRALLAGGEER